MTELSFFEKLTSNLKLSKAGRVGMTLSYFDVIELLGELEALKLYADELESEIAVHDEESHNKVHELSKMKIARDELQTRIATLESELVNIKQKLTDCEARNKELELLAYGSEQEQLRRNALWGFGASGTSRYGD